MGQHRKRHAARRHPASRGLTLLSNPLSGWRNAVGSPRFAILLVVSCVTAGMGIGFLPEIVIASELKKKQFVTLNWEGPKLSIATSIVWHKDKWVSPGMQAFLDVLKTKLHEATTPTLVRDRAS